ncbi:MAG: ATP-grasp domain-containing protein [Planctomycetota bacterium]
MMNVLVFPCGSEIGLEIHRAVRFSRHVSLVGASSVSSNHGRYVYNRYVDGLPFVDEFCFLQKLNEVVDRYDIDFVFPAHDSVALALARAAGELRCKVIGSPVRTCEVCRSKSATYAALGSSLRVPLAFSVDSPDFPRPAFLKPDVGQGSKGTCMVQSPEEAQFFLKKDPSLIALEYLPGREFTVDCFTDRHRQLRFVGGRRRVRTSGGISVDTAPFDDPRFRSIAETIHSAFCFRGPWFFQLKETALPELALLEVAPRVSGCMGLFRNLGVNIPLLSIFDAADMDVDVFQSEYPIRMDRALDQRFAMDLSFDHVYIDLDDTLILNGQVNVTAVAFLYQCRNRRIGIHLLTRCVEDVESRLENFRLRSLLDTVLCAPKSIPKSRYITKPKAIFIDDSFAERKEVHDSLGIPTFALDMLESLLRERDDGDLLPSGEPKAPVDQAATDDCVKVGRKQ